MGQERHLAGEVVSVNVGRSQPLDWRGQKVRTAIQKAPVRGRVMAQYLNLDGDYSGSIPRTVPYLTGPRCSEQVGRKLPSR